jgi:hypothetical protein
MVRGIAQEVARLLDRHSCPSGSLTAALREDDDRLWTYLVSDELWGGAGSVADQAILDSPGGRSELESLLVRLGREQLVAGRINCRTEMWVTAFEKRRRAASDDA